MVGYFSAVLAKFFQNQFFRGFHLIFLRDVIPVFAGLTNQAYFNTVFSFFSHTCDYTLFKAALEEYSAEPKLGIEPKTSFLPRKRSATELFRLVCWMRDLHSRRPKAASSTARCD